MLGIIANPLSGKDIRRVVAQGVTTSNHDKINLLRRMLQSITALAGGSVRFMPDRADLVPRALDGLKHSLDAQPLDLVLSNTAEDTIQAAQMLSDQGAACIIVLGGDGTCRAVAKGAGSVPLLPVSTGTNNAFPQTVEGTLAGLAAAIVARGLAADAIHEQPCLRVLRESEVVDLALIDVAVYEGTTGARAVWQMEHVRQLVTTRYTPGTIGLSAIAGYAGLVPPAPDMGLVVTLGDGAHHVLAPVAPGLVQPIAVSQHRWLAQGERTRIASVPCVLALDGERELDVRRGMLVDVQFDQHGPRVVDVQRALELGVQAGVFTKH